MVASLVVPAGIASATSSYDDVIQPVESIHLSRDGGVQGSPVCTLMDVTSSWANILTDSSSWTSRTQIIGGATQTATLADWAITLGNGAGWAVVQQHNNNASTPDWGSPIADAVYVVFSPSTSAQIDFSSRPIYWGAQKQAYMTNTDDGYVYSVRIQFDDLGAAWGDDRCTPVISMALREPSSTPSYWEHESIAATSTESLNGYSLRPLFVNATVNYPSGYEGKIVAGESPAVKYGALGDSYSSGEGNPPFEYGTDVSNTNGCHRSLQAYPRLLQSDLDLGSTAFVACSGATTANITGGQWNEPPQTDALTGETEVVTLTIGGNDVGFTDYAIACSVTCGYGSIPYNTIMGKISDPDFKDALVDTYEAILDVNEDLDLYVADYPYIAEEDATTCWGLDFSGAYDVQTALNDVIFDAVVEVGLNSNRIFMVQTNYPGSPFEGGELCGDGTPLFHELVAPPNVEYSLHPNAAGQAAYAEVFEEAMS